MYLYSCNAKMSLTISITYPKRIEIEQGTPVKVNGSYTKADHISAFFIHDARRGISFQLRPDEIPPIKKYKDTPEMLVGEVIGCHQFGESTHLDILPFEGNLYDYKRLSTGWARISVPAYWQLLDEKIKWESSLKDAESRLWELKQQVPQPYDASELVLAMRRYAQRQPDFRLEFCTRYLWESVEKQLMAARHLERLEILHDLHRHFEAASKLEVREWLINRVHEECGLVFEAAVMTIYSSLDILSHVINEVYKLNFLGRTATFNLVVNGRQVQANEQVSGQPLPHNNTLKTFLDQECQGWIFGLAKWRHHVIHHGCVEGGMRVRLVQDAESFMPDAVLEGESREIIRTWTERLLKLLEGVVRISSAHIEALSKTLPVTTKTESELLQKPDTTQANVVVRSFLDLWTLDTSDLDDGQKKERHLSMFRRLLRVASDAWDLKAFAKYIDNHPLKSWEILPGVFHSSGIKEGEQYTFSVVLTFDSWGQSLWWFVLQPIPKNQKNELAIRFDLPLSIPPSFDTRLQLLDFARHQSGKETGFRDVVFVVSLANTSADTIENVEVHIFWMDVSQSSETVGTMSPGEVHNLIISWKDAFMPISRDVPLIADALMGELCVRVIYRYATQEGVLWSQNFFVSPGGITELP